MQVIELGAHSSEQEESVSNKVASKDCPWMLSSDGHTCCGTHMPLLTHTNLCTCKPTHIINKQKEIHASLKYFRILWSESI